MSPAWFAGRRKRTSIFATISRQIDYRGTIITVHGCNSMHDLYRRARKAGLSKQAAHALAYTPSIDASPSAEQISWDTLLAVTVHI